MTRKTTKPKTVVKQGNSRVKPKYKPPKNVTNKYLLEYIEAVETGTIKTCPEQKQLVAFVRRVFENEDIYTDDELCERYMALQRFFPFTLFPWECFCFVLHMVTFRRDGTLRFPELFIYVTRGSGKNGYLEFEDFACASPVHGVKNYDISTYATGEDNAKRSFDELHDILEGDKQRFKSAFKWNSEKITNIKTNSTITFKTSNPKTKDGGREGKINFDEVHSYEDMKIYEVAITGLGKKPFARITYTSTQGYVRDSLLDLLLERSAAILEGTEPDNGFLPFLCMLHSKADVINPDKWEECNPSIRYFPELRRSYERELALYKRNPGINTSFPIKRCNFLVDTLSAIANREDIVACTSGPLPETLDLRGCDAIVGIDYAKINDMLDVGLLVQKDDMIYWISHAYICEKSEDYDDIKYDLQAAEERGELTILRNVNGFDAEQPLKWAKETAQKMGLRIIAAGADNYRIPYMEQAFRDELGMKCEKRQKGNEYGKKKGICYINRISNNEKTYPLIFQHLADHKIYCGFNKTMRWFLGNVYKDEVNGVFKIEKIERHRRKTDGVYALIAAYAVMLDIQANKGTKPKRAPKVKRH